MEGANFGVVFSVLQVALYKNAHVTRYIDHIIMNPLFPSLKVAIKFLFYNEISLDSLVSTLFYLLSQLDYYKAGHM